MKSPDIIIIISSSSSITALSPRRGVILSHPTPIPLQCGMEQEYHRRERHPLFPPTRPQERRRPTQIDSGYVNFCTDSVIPTKTVRCFPNNKPWVTTDIRASLNRKKVAFRSGDKEEMKKAQTELREKTKEGKDCYRRKLERELQQKNSREVWRGMRAVTGHGKKTGQGREGVLDDANELNLYFNRFDELASAHPPPQFLNGFPPP
ncbi:hypothetical protein PGIGA_G00220440 [Pangasianodon gigas]|uniref:Uncharacterized protein n=1 Tax=Pangasianodon gigas TaxID=30993 RepID=A0ACC5WIX9_PANGG|nr:hypothetical protein [Pangasianodon gigas]